MIHVYYGNGQGKTSAALGLAIRAHGHGLRVVVVQFLKNMFSGELVSLEQLGIPVLRGQEGNKFVIHMTAEEKMETLHIHDSNLQKGFSAACDMLILDEVLDACKMGLLEEEKLAQQLAASSEKEIILTGHQPISWLFETADYVTEMVGHKHPYDLGVKARMGIEY